MEEDKKDKYDMTDWIIDRSECTGKELSADEMFKKLTYKKMQPIGTQKASYSNGLGKEIIFVNNRVVLYGIYQHLDMKELEAVNKKCEELGWRNE